MRGLIKRLEQLRIKDAMLILDYDGTLTPIVNKPKDATLSTEMRGMISSISKFIPICIMSGRSLSEVKSLVNISDIYYAGNHGMEIMGPEVSAIIPGAKKTIPLISTICTKLSSKLENVKGVLVENKGLTASLHYRLVSAKEVPLVKRIFDSVVEDYVNKGKIKITSGKKVLEIRPAIEWDKGKSSIWALHTIKPHGLPIYLGDNRTDEDAFKALKDKGITILVSAENKKTNALYRLRNVVEVEIFLKALLARCKDIEYEPTGGSSGLRNVPTKNPRRLTQFSI